MRIPCRWIAALILLLLCTTALAGFDPQGVDILGLRLGMSRIDLLHRLATQGIAGSRVHERYGPCPAATASGCAQQLTATTWDGSLLIRFVARDGPGSETVWSIAYTLTGRGAGEPAMIRNAVLNRFGPPTANQPPMWCAIGDASGCTPPDQPQLTFVEGPGTSSTLTLSDPAAVHAPP